VWWMLWMSWLLMNFSRIIWIISVLIENFHSWWSFGCLELVFDLSCTWNGLAYWLWFGPF
jgi:hypothetical protein